MKIIKALSIAVGVAATIALTGCNPDKCSITLPVSAIEKASKGAVGYAKMRVSYMTTQSDVVQKLPQIKSILEQILGETANVQISNLSEGRDKGSLNVSLKIPVEDKGKGCFLNSSVAGFTLEGEWLSFAEQKGLEKLNEKLSDIDFTIKGEFNSDMDIMIKNDTEHEFVFLACGVFVDNRPCVCEYVKVPMDEEVTITFKRGSEDSVYHYKNPTIKIVGK